MRSRIDYISRFFYTVVYGKMMLFFGCRRSAEDNLYKAERDNMETEGVLTAQHVAISREPGKPKVSGETYIIAR